MSPLLSWRPIASPCKIQIRQVEVFFLRSTRVRREREFFYCTCICSFSDKPQTRSGRRERHKVGGIAGLNAGTQNGAGGHCCRPPVEATFGNMLKVVVNNRIEHY